MYKKMFRNKKIVGLIISSVIAMASAGVYFYSLQLLDEDESLVHAETPTAPESEHPEGQAEVELAHNESEHRQEASESHPPGKGEGEKHASEHGEPEHEPKMEVTDATLKAHEDLLASESYDNGDRKKYRPKIIGRCKKLFEQFNRETLAENQFHAFAFSFDGQNGYCAVSGAQKSDKLAKEIALTDCEKNKENAQGYAPCYIYTSNN
jgi:hypothetical protein